MIYFIAAEGSSLIKIGVTNNLSRRLTELMRGGLSGLTVIRTFDGDRKVESAIHSAMTGWRRQGEWFDGEAARAFIADAEASGLTAAIDLWQTRKDERHAQSRKECREGAAKFIAVLNDAFDGLIAARSEAVVRSLLKMPPARFSKRTFQAGDDMNIYLLSAEPQRESLRAAWGELVGATIAPFAQPLPSVLNADSAKPAETPREKVERLQIELFRAVEELTA